MKTASKYATKLPDTVTQKCLKWARKAGSFSTLELAIDLLDCQTIGDAAHRKAGRVLTGYRKLFDEMGRSRGGSQWRMKLPADMPDGVLFPLAEFRDGVDVGLGWGFRKDGKTYEFATIQSARIGLIRNA